MYIALNCTEYHAAWFSYSYVCMYMTVILLFVMSLCMFSAQPGRKMLFLNSNAELPASEFCS